VSFRQPITAEGSVTTGTVEPQLWSRCAGPVSCQGKRGADGQTGTTRVSVFRSPDQRLRRSPSSDFDFLQHIVLRRHRWRRIRLGLEDSSACRTLDRMRDLRDLFLVSLRCRRCSNRVLLVKWNVVSGDFSPGLDIEMHWLR